MAHAPAPERANTAPPTRAELRGAGDRPAACQAAADWAAANPSFLEALNLGVGTAPWTPDILCGHIDIDDHGPWEHM